MILSRISCVIALALITSGCPKVYEVTPDLEDSFAGIPLNGGRTQAVTVDPTNRRHIIIATQFGGLWKTTNGGARWRHVRRLQAVFVNDVQFAPDGRTVIATLSRDNRTVNGGGIYVSRDAGNTWSRPPTGVVASDARTPARGGAYGVDFDRDDPETWYVGTDFGIARSDDNGASWQHFKVASTDTVSAARDQDRAMAVLALGNGVVLAMLNGGIYRSDTSGSMWREIRDESFAFYNWVGFNKMERERNGPAAFILKDYTTLYYYEPGPDAWTTLALPAGGGSRSPFVRVSKAPVLELPFGIELDLFPWFSTIWVGQGVRAIAALTASPATTKALAAGDWVVHGRGDGIHDDTGDLGVAGDLRPVMLGTDGGVFVPTSGQVTAWQSGAPDGSRFNSLQITDLAGTNTDSDDSDLETTLYFSTQDNAIWSSNDNGRSWPRSDCSEGFHVEVREVATTGAPITVGYGKIGCGPSENMYSDAFLANQRAVPNMDAGGGTLDAMFQAFYLLPGHWIRSRAGDPGAGRNPGIYVSSNDGDSWSRRFDLGVVPHGVYRHSNIQFGAANMSAYLPVGDGQANADGSLRLGLIRLNSLVANRVDNVGTADIIQLPDNGSLARRATEFDWQVVYGVHPRNAEFIIAPDIVNQDVKMTRDGGDNWTVNQSLTLAATRGGEYLLWDRSEYRMQITHISYDPYNDDRIFVGTRDVGIICSRDGGVTWRSLPRTIPIRYITGFQFRPSGSVLVSTYGRGLWRIRAKHARCIEGREWTTELPVPPSGLETWVPWEQYRTRQVALEEPDEGADDQPSGADRPGQPMLGGQSSPLSVGDVVLDDSNRLTIRGRGFDGASGAPLIVYLDGAGEPYRQLGPPDAEGGFVAQIEVPDDLDFGQHRLEVRQEGAGEQYRASLWFRKVHTDEHLGDEPAPSQFEQENAWEDKARRLYDRVKQSGELQKLSEEQAR